MEPDDDTLMHQFARGDARAFDALYERHHGPLYRFVRRLLGSACPQQVDEVFQDSWLRVVHARSTWAPQGASFRTWLFTLAHHRAIDCLRRSGREVTLDDDADAPAPAVSPWSGWPPPSSAEGDGADHHFWREAGRRLLDCLDALPATQRSAFLLHHEDGLSLDDMARTLELGFETAKSRLRYAMNKLRHCMGAYLPGTGGAA